MDLMDLFVKIGVKDEASASIAEIASKLGNGLKTAAKVGIAAVTAAGTAVGALTKKAIDNYAEYEQLVGGIETLFNDASKTVQKYASEAWKTAGMSANEYMSTATSFAASLLQSFTDTSGAVTEEMAEDMISALDEQEEAQEKANAKQLDNLKEAQNAEVEAFQKATDKKIELINQQYKENLKLVDEEEYRRVKAIDDQIAALNDQTKAEKAELKAQKQQNKIADLEAKATYAKTAKEREKAAEELSEYLAEIEQETREAQRTEQIAALNEQKQAVKDEASAKRDALKEQNEAEIAAVKETSDARLKEIKKANEAEIEALKETNDRKLKELQKFNDKQKEMISASIGQVDGATELSGEAYEAAAKSANTAIVDMSDNANKMGTDISMIQSAYQGFAKQNYTMLDNLKLGYGGTKTEMERLISDANRVKETNGEMADLSIDRFADVVEAIHEVQKELYISGMSAEDAAAAVESGALTQEEAYLLMGTTAKEASTTIEGSMKAVKATWQNLLTSISKEEKDFAKGESFETYINAFIESVSTAGANLIPRLKTSLKGIGKLISGLAPVISRELPGLVNTVLPDLLNSAVMLVDGVIAALPELIQTLATALVENMPLIVNAGFTLLESLVTFLSENAGMLTQGALDLIFALANGLIESLPTMIPSIVNIILEMVKVLTDPENLSNLITTGLDLIIALIDGILNSLPELIAAAPEIIANLILGITDALPDLIMQGPIILGKLVFGIIKSLPDLLMLGPRIVMKIIDGIIGKFKKLKDTGGEILQKIKDGIGDAWTALKDVGSNLIKGLWNGVKDTFNWIKERFTSVIDFIKAIFTGEDGFDEHSPSKWSEGVMDYVMKGMVNGVDKGKNKVFKAANTVVDKVKSIFDTPIDTSFSDSFADIDSVISPSMNMSNFEAVPAAMRTVAVQMPDNREDETDSRPTTVILQIDKKTFGQVTFDAVRNQEYIIGERAIGVN